MELITKEIFTTVTFYEAFDGTEFDDEYDCEEYEYIEKLKRLKKWDVYLNETSDLDDTIFVYLPDEVTMQYFKDCCKFDGMSCEGIHKESKGVYMWMGDNWESLTKINGFFTKTLV